MSADKKIHDQFMQGGATLLTWIKQSVLTPTKKKGEERQMLLKGILKNSLLFKYLI